jgi:hypothetical protein
MPKDSNLVAGFLVPTQRVGMRFGRAAPEIEARE